ncbi:hypothetical protein BGX23_005713 [Mortierella sp. AD031]|nr:hypothetical protein BGX23_005713 [Mortierella sp. AD031]
MSITPGFGLNLDNPFDASCKYLVNTNNNNNGANLTGTSKADSEQPYYSYSDNRIAMSSAPLQHPWSDLVFDEAYLPIRQMTPGISPPSSAGSSASYSSSSSASALYPPSSTSPIHAFHPQMMSMSMATATDHLISRPEGSQTLTHEYNTLYDKKSYHSDQDLPQLSPDSPSPDSLVPTGIFRKNSIAMPMTNSAQPNDAYRTQHVQDSNKSGEDMSDVDNSDMDVDSNEHNDEHDDADTGASPASQSSRDLSTASESSSIRATRRRTSKRVAAAAISTKPDPRPLPKSSSKSKRASSSSSKSKAGKDTASANSKKAATAKSVGVSKTMSQLRKHSSPEEESPEAKRQKFLERNRMAASKCREKKRLQTLKTIEDADIITARNQALHESLDELQEEVRTLKNLILCHRDCGCDVIQKFVQSSFKVPSIQVQELRDDSQNVELSSPESPSLSSPSSPSSPTFASREVDEGDEADEVAGKGIVDHTTFDQLLEMDDEEEFSRNLVHNYFEQAQRAFRDMDEAMSASDLEALSRLGHFLKGSSAQLGVLKVKASCEKLQYYGQGMDAAGQHSHISNEEAEKQIQILLIQMRREYDEAEHYLRGFYGEEQEQEDQ